MTAEILRRAIDLDSLPRALPDRPRVIARLKAVPEDFEVEEVPIYPPEGTGSHLFLWVEKRDTSGGELLRRLGAALGVRPDDIGSAGTKDRRAVTRQWLSVPETCLPRLEAGVTLDRIQVLSFTRHSRKLRLGHLAGNRFRILLRDADPAMADLLAETARLLEAGGFHNLYGAQRFGRDGETALQGLRALQAGAAGGDPGMGRMGHFERRMSVSALQSALFNLYLADRAEAGQDRTVLKGDVMSKATGGLFWADDVAVEQARLDSGETRLTGPMFGHKMMAARDDGAAFEQAVLDRTGLVPAAFKVFAKLAEGTRRVLRVHPAGFQVAPDPDGIVLTFTLPKGSYASVLLREFTAGPEVARADGE